MKNKSTPRNYTRGQKIFWISLAAILSAAFIFLVAWAFIFFIPAKTPAEVVNAPIAKELVNAGAVRKCESVADGKNIDSRNVGVLAYYEVPLPRDRAIQVAVEAARRNGYDLQQATSQNRPEGLSVADDYVKDWYFDVTSKRSQFKELNDGHIKLFFGFYNDIDEGVNCGGTVNLTHVKGSDEQTVIQLRVDLPDLKQL